MKKSEESLAGLREHNQKKKYLKYGNFKKKRKKGRKYIYSNMT